MISIEERGIPVPDDSRKTRPQNCPVKVRRIPAVDATDEAFSDFLIVL